MLNTSEADYFALRRLILIDAYRKGAITELKLDGHTSLTGANGVGKTSLLRLIPLFYGESPNKLVQGGGVNQSFVQYYLPHTTSFIVFEYSRRGKVCMVVLYASRSGESVYYRFIDQPFASERFRDDGNLVIGPDLNRHIRKRGEFCSEQITALSDYRSIIQNAVSVNREHRTLAANFSFVGPGGRLSHIEKIVTGMFSRVTNFRDIKRIVVSCIVDDKNNIRLETSTSVMKGWVRDYRAYVVVMGQAGRMRDFQAAQMHHEEAARELHLVHTDFARLQQAQESAIEQKKSRAGGIRNEMRLLEDQANDQLREIGTQLGVAEGQVKILKGTLQELEKQYRAYENDDLLGLARMVDALPQLAEDLETKDKREKALLGESQDLANRYAELHNLRIEAFHNLERGKNALKEPIRVRGKGEEAQARQAADEAWQAIVAEFERQEEAISHATEALVEQLGGLKHAAEHPQASSQAAAARDQARGESDAALDAATTALSLYAEAKTAHEAEKVAFNAILTLIQDFHEREKKDQAVRAHLLSLKDAAPGTLLHFLRENRPGWTRDIARVVPEQLLLRTDLTPTLVSEEALSLYGIGLDLAALDVPMAADEEVLRQKIEEVDRAIEQHQRDAKAKEKELPAQSERVCQAKSSADDKQRLHVQANNAARSCKAAFEAAERALAEDIRQSGIHARQRLQEVRQSVEMKKRALSTLKSTRNARKLSHESELKNRLAVIEARVQTDIGEIDQVIALEKSSCDQEVCAQNEELGSALKARGVDTASLEKLQKEKSEAQDRLQKARSNEAKVGDWRRWMKSEWETRSEKDAQLKMAESGVQQLLEQKSQARKVYDTKHDALDRALGQLNQEQVDVERLHGFVVSRREKLTKWPADTIGPMDKPLRDQDALEADMDRLLLDIQNEESRAREVLKPIRRTFFESPGTPPYQFYDKKRLELGPDQGGASPFLWLAPMQEWFEAEHENARRLLLSQCRNFASGIHEFHDRLNGFKRKVSNFSKDLQENMAASTRFRFISSVAVRITTSFDDLEGWSKIKEMDDEYGVWAGKDSNDLPDSAFADAVDQVSDWLQGRHTLDVKLEDLLGLEIDIEEVGHPRKTVKDEGQLRDASSNGLSYLILCVVFVGLINKIRTGQPVQLVWALDELRDLDLDNVRVLLDMLADNQIHLVSAFPDPEPEILALLKNRYAIQEGRRLATFQPEVVNV